MSTEQDAGATIREIAPGDYDRWRPLWDGYNEFYGRVGASALSPERVDRTWSRFFEQSEPVHALVAESTNELLGIAHYVFHRSTIDLEDVCYLQDLFVAQAGRRRGVARALIEGVCERATRAKAARMYWHTHESNQPAINLYSQLAERSGFIVFRKSPSA